jgi:hypothetical protein
MKLFLFNLRKEKGAASYRLKTYFDFHTLSESLNAVVCRSRSYCINHPKKADRTKCELTMKEYMESLRGGQVLKEY